MSSPHPSSDHWSTWSARLRSLCDGIRERTRAGLVEALRADGGHSVAFPVGEGAGDVTFGLDVPSEEHIDQWLREEARAGPLSLLTEDRGWRHMGPGPDGAGVRLAGFDHGGPRIAIDPVDGTRNLMNDLRSAWTVVSFAPPGRGEPRLADVSAGIVAELPPSRSSAYRVLQAERGGPCTLEEHDLAGPHRGCARRLVVDDDDRVDQGYFPIFRYQPDQRPAIARLEAGLFARLARHEGADTRSVYDDQYISNAGQLVLLSLGTYRMLIDPRALIGQRSGTPTVTSKPYDVAGALVCAAAAGVALSAADGSELDFPLDARTPVHFAGYANAATRARIEPHWLATLTAG